MKSNLLSMALLTAVLALAATPSVLHSLKRPDPPAQAPEQAPVLVNTCLITSNVRQLTIFYEKVLQIRPREISDAYVEFPTAEGVLAIFAADAQEKYIPNSAVPAMNKSAILEFKVNDPDQEFARLQSIVKTWVKPPTTQPWGTRSIYFRDPDGNLVDFFTPPKKP
jgi:catechol 2,3-dioxygenase-like lactoylglutathione lyase family enzyme